MYFRILLAVISLTMGYTALEAGPINAVKKIFKAKEVAKPSSIKLLLVDNQEGAILEVKGGYKVIDPNTGKRISRGVVGKNYYVQPTMDGLKWGEGFPGIFQITIQPNEPSTLTLVNGVQHTGSISVYQIGNNISIVNELPVEEFVKCMLGQLINEPKSSELLNAMAITLRSSAMYHANKSLAAFWHISAKDINYPGYTARLRGFGAEEAVDKTKYLVLHSDKYGLTNGSFDATMTEDSAGATVPYHLIYHRHGAAPEIGVVVPMVSKTKWDTSISMQDLAQQLEVTEVKDLELSYDNQSNKVFAITLHTDKGAQEFDFITFQRLLGKDIIKSSEFSFKKDAERLHFTGRGQGSGVGLCLSSAEKMAEKGRNAAEILEVFFPQSHIVLCNK